MEQVLTHLLAAHQSLKDQAISAIQNNQEVDEYILNALKSLYALLTYLHTQLAAVAPPEG